MRANGTSTAVFRNMSDDVYVAIQKLQHPITRATVYMPEGQAVPDTKTTLERDGLIYCLYDEYGKYVSTIVYDPGNIRVICWMLTQNAENHRSPYRTCSSRSMGTSLVQPVSAHFTTGDRAAPDRLDAALSARVVAVDDDMAGVQLIQSPTCR